MSSTVIPREKLSAYQRWELRSLDDDRAEPAKPAASVRTDRRTRDEGFEAGYRDGKAAGKAEIVQAHAAQSARLHELVNTLARDIAQLDSQIADQVLDLAIMLARRMVGDTLNAQPERALDIVRESLQMLGQARKPARLMLHPEDALLVRKHLGDQCASGDWIIIEDSTINRGGCRLESAGGELDATLPERWRRILAALGRTDAWLG